MIVLTLYFVRHAHSMWTIDEQRPLSTAGQKSAERVSDILQQYPISTIYSSPYRRAIQTITPLATVLNLPIHKDHRLVERRIGDAPIADFHKAISQLWLNPHMSFPGGESNHTARKRGKKFLATLCIQPTRDQASLKHIVVTTHGNLMALILQHFYPCVDYYFWSKLSFPDIFLVPIDDSHAKNNGSIKGSHEHILEVCRYPVRLWD